MPEPVSLTTMTIVLALFWFVVYWIVGGVIFAIISVTRFLHIHKARFSCAFTFLSMGAAYGAAWMATRSIAFRPGCVHKVKGMIEVFPALFTCGGKETLSSGLLWFLLLMAVGIAMMLIFRGAEERKS